MYNQAIPRTLSPVKNDNSRKKEKIATVRVLTGVIRCSKCDTATKYIPAFKNSIPRKFVLPGLPG